MQKVFAETYISNKFNATQAAITAGYSQKTARSQGQRLLTRVYIMTYIKKRIRAILSETELVTMKWVDRVNEIAFSKPNETHDKYGELLGYDYNNQLKALDLLGKYLSLYSDLKISIETEKETLSKEQRREKILQLNKELGNK